MKTYLYSEYTKLKTIWFTVPKAGTKTIHDALYHMGVDYIPEKFKSLKNHHDDFFKFCFTRNPWDRILSTFKDKAKKVWQEGGFAGTYTLSGGDYKLDSTLSVFEKWKESSFREFILDLDNEDLSIDRHIQEQHAMFPVNQIDFFGKLENLQKDFDVVCKKIGLPETELPHKNKTIHKHYTEYYDDETRQIVAKRYAKDIEYFGYEFGE